MKPSNTPISELMLRARVSLRGKWGAAVGAVAIYLLYLAVGNAVPGWAGWPLAGLTSLAYVLLSPVAAFGISVFFLRVARGDTSLRMVALLDGFRRFLTLWAYYLLFILYMLPFIVAMLFVILISQNSMGYIPFFLLIVALCIGMIAVLLPFLLTPLVIADHAGISAIAAMRESRRLMRGNILRFIGLCLRCAAWMVLGLMALVVGVLWTWAYVSTAFGHFYQDLRDRDAAAALSGA